ncbi:Fe3+ ABC transporter, periplasmic iron-binding protein [[Leptolyngbya] sp. PCC 7376]|uniref:ABC transporter substrate-binding protein n=1 Tax=[Leptolyngbya] sp. PCC 7376 TaxID=111781 RepID=UPI00029F2A09|nr:ABC transporter substrate-binding protein [[Leptolyngbya] sp. PCC 7376]AFY40485.1 Fe3+ ABC transporter, periplasmic iron-binding protein [[Leptolyngbya] sp. PCC 7376]
MVLKLWRSPQRSSQVTNYFRPTKTISFALSFGFFLTACQSTVTTPEIASNNDCVEQFDKNTDYFPDKVDPQFAQGFEVEYHTNYKVVTVKQPWEEAAEDLNYIFVQCGTPAPTDYPNATIVEIPTQRVLAMSTTYLPHIEKLDQLESLVGVTDRRLIYSDIIRKKIEEGVIQEVGDLQSDAEKILNLQTDVILSYRLDNTESSGFKTLEALNQPIVLDAAHLEATPLGRAEWLKFTALLFNGEAKANAEFTAIAQRYQDLIKQTQTLANSPTILSGSPFQGVWYMPAGKSYVAQFFRDANINYPWSETDSRLSLPLDLEAVLDQAKDADIWVNVNPAWQSAKDVLAEDKRYGLFAAFETKQVYAANARVAPEGGNDFWESGVTNPDIVLADLIKIAYPEQLPEHELYYYQQLN